MQSSQVFPDGFLWGSSTNAQQFEGGFDQGGRGLSIADVRTGDAGFRNASDQGYEKFKTASDHYHHMAEDIRLFGEMGMTIYRFSMSWSRILPNGNDAVPNEEGLVFYDQMLAELEKYGIQPVCTLYAYDCPEALVRQYGGFRDRRIIDDYCRYVDIVSTRFKGRIKHYVPFNEQNTMAGISLYAMGIEACSDEEKFAVDHNLNLCWAKATRIIHQNDPDAKVSGNLCNVCTYPADCNPESIRQADMQNITFGYAYADIFARKTYSAFFYCKYPNVNTDTIIMPGDMETIAAAEPDELSVTYYMSNLACANGERSDTLLNTKMSNPYTKQTEWGWNIDPYGFEHMLIDLWHRYQLPILVLENGLGHTDIVEPDGSIADEYRIEYLRNHITAMREAIGLGAKLVGYCTWSAIDLYSTHEGFSKRYGFIYIDENTLTRSKKQSYDWYRNVIASNGAEL